MKTVLFACVHNAGRSQMAAAFFNAMVGAADARAISAGTRPAERVHPEVVDAMREVGIDLSGARPQLLTPELARVAELLVTLGRGDECPAVPGQRRDDWPLDHPGGQTPERVREIRDEIERRVRRLVTQECGELRPPPARSPIPYAGRSVIALAPEQFAAIRRTVASMFRIAHSPAYERRVDAGADGLARFAPGNFGVFMGYDFHLTPEGPRLIEVNTNAGGALLNGLHTAALCDPARLSCLCEELLPVETMRQRIARTFAAELEAARPGACLSRVAIADERPREQFLHAEFELVAELLEEQGVRAAICDTSELARTAGGLELGGRRVDLVYLRDTDFMLAARRSAAVRAAYLAREVVVTPSPREHHLLANKRRLELFSSREALRGLGVSEADARFLSQVVPETRALRDMDLEQAWRERGDWVFKPCASFGSRGVYRGDKISRRRLGEIARDPGFLAQRRVAPGTLEVDTSEGPRAMKFDVRAYAYRDEVLLLGARIYAGQVTNLRSPGGGFSAICVARSAECGAADGSCG